jgi:hypothetical protein
MMGIVELARTIGIARAHEQTAEKKLMIAKRRFSRGTGREMSMAQGVRQGRLFEVEAVPVNATPLGQKCGAKMPRLEQIVATVNLMFRVRVWISSGHQKKKDGAGTGKAGEGTRPNESRKLGGRGHTIAKV